MTRPTNPLSIETQAFNRARVALNMVDDDACRRGWDRLEADFGWSVASKAWRDAARAIDEEVERREWCCDYCGTWSANGATCVCGCTQTSWAPIEPTWRVAP